jgi:putative transposase
MPNTYTQIYLQLVFAVEDRFCLIRKEWQDELYKYITGIVQNNRHKLLTIDGMPDHVHVFIGYKPYQSVSDLLQDIKEHSSKWINTKGFLSAKFNWQEGYGAFSYSHSHIDRVIKYINNQERHHKKILFIDEYIALLKRFNIEYDERYIFHEVKMQ